jgi:hypothetical protein
MKLDREEVAALLKDQAAMLNVKVLHEGRNEATFALEVDGEVYDACCLSTSTDYYRHRLNLYGDYVDMIVVGEHLSCVPVSTLALDEGYFYAPAEFPRWFDPEVKRHRNSMVLIGGMISGVEEAWTIVNGLARATRYRYVARMKQFLKNRDGRKLAI